MSNDSFGQICELSYHHEIGPCLPQLVRELHDRLLGMGLQDFSMTWDCDDIAYFELAGQRILLAYADRPRADIASKLLVSVGPAQDAPSDLPVRLSHAALCRRIVRSLDQKHPSDQRQMRSFPGVLSPERVDDILYATPTAAPPVAEVPKAAAADRANAGPTHYRSPYPARVYPRVSEQQLRASIFPARPARSARILAISVMINSATWSMVPAASAAVLTDFGPNMIEVAALAPADQLPR